MCGIAGIYKKGRLDAADIRAVLTMIDAQCHRGPDDWGLTIPASAANSPEVREVLSSRSSEHILTYPDSPGAQFVLGSRRLAILDLSSAGHMPMTSSSGKTFITYNGEIYNFRAVRADLEALGCVFRSDSDTEVILQGYEQWGPAVVERLRGMFGFAIADITADTPKLLLARDRLGIKPLYHSQQGSALCFASEYRALAQARASGESFTHSALISFLQLGSIALPNTTDADIIALPSGSTLSYSGDQIAPKCYWSVTAPALQTVAPPDTIESYAAKLRPILRGAVESHLVSDVPLGIFLSGGMDSSALAVLASRSRSTPVTTISVIFDEPEFSEQKFARLVAEQCGSDHREITLGRKDFYDGLDAMLRAMDQPTVDGVNVYVVSGAARQAGVKVVLSGAGGDELFLGYSFSRSIEDAGILQKSTSWLTPGLRASMLKFGIFAGSLAGRQSMEKLEYLNGSSDEDVYLMFRGLFSPQEIRELLGLSSSDIAHANAVRESIAVSAGGSLLNRISLMDFKHYLGNQLLKDCDFMSMAHSLETRVPFLDHVLVEEVLKIPAEVRLSKNKVPKPLLVAAMGNDLPRQVWDRPKMGFILPFDKWMRTGSHELEARCQDNGVLDRKAVAEVWNRFRRGESHWSRPWALVVLSEWMSRTSTKDPGRQHAALNAN